MERLLLDLSINTTAMFRDPPSISRSETTSPMLRTYRSSASGTRAVRRAKRSTDGHPPQEEGLYDRCRIYATDINEAVLQKAKSGIFTLSTMQENTSNYIAGGGTGTFSDYYTARYDYAIFRPSLRENVVFAQHNLVTDASFNHFNVIFCRNVLIYFNNALQDRVQQLFLQSMEMFGILGSAGRSRSIHERRGQLRGGRCRGALFGGAVRRLAVAVGG
jgi:chemotaxis protein methyltransferase CheR